MANNVDPDQTAPLGAVCSVSMLFASILNLSVMLGNYLADDFSRRHFQMHFFLGALRVSKRQKHFRQGSLSHNFTYDPLSNCKHHTQFWDKTVH